MRLDPHLQSTPWGAPQSRITVTPGITRVDTESHGGYVLDEARVAAMPAPLRTIGNGPYFEEDVAWCAVPLAFPDVFSSDIVEQAHQTCKHWFPEAWEAWTQTTLQPGESRAKDQQAWYAAHANDYIVTTAWGDWHQRVPEGMVGVCACKGGRRNPFRVSIPSSEAFFLVPAKEYDARNPRDFGFLIDETRHVRIDPITTAS